MTLKQMEQDFHFLRGQVQRLSRLIDALESSPLLIQAMTQPDIPSESNAPAQEVSTIAKLEKEAILNARDTFGKNPIRVCHALGISRTSYYRKLKKYGVRR